MKVSDIFLGAWSDEQLVASSAAPDHHKGELMDPLTRMWHAVECPIRRRWLRFSRNIPFWRDDNVAQALEIAHLGCPRCGQNGSSSLEVNR